MVIIMENIMKRVYLIYDASNIHHASQLCQAIEKRGIACFMRHGSLPEGEEEDSILVKMAVEGASAVVVIQSEQLHDSPVAGLELSVAAEHHLPGVVFHIDDSDESINMSQFQHINARKHPHQLYHQAAATLESLVSPKGVKRQKRTQIFYWLLSLVAITLAGAIFIITNQHQDATLLDDIHIEDCEEINYSNTYELIRNCRTSDVLEHKLPFKLRFGMNQNEVNRAVESYVIRGGIMDINKDFRIDMPDVGVKYTFMTENGVRCDMQPLFNSKDVLVGLRTSFLPSPEYMGNFRQETLEHYMTEYYASYKRYVIRTPKITVKYILIKANELVEFHFDNSSSKIEMHIYNVPEIDDKQYEQMLLAVRNTKQLFHID